MIDDNALSQVIFDCITLDPNGCLRCCCSRERLLPQAPGDRVGGTVSSFLQLGLFASSFLCFAAPASSGVLLETFIDQCFLVEGVYQKELFVTPLCVFIDGAYINP